MRLALPALIVAALALPAAAAGGVHMVPQEHATIQGAVDAAADGDTILISHGHYPEAVVVSGKNQLQILCKGKVVIDPPGGTGLTLDGCTNCSVEKLRVGGGAPFGILIQDGHGYTRSTAALRILGMLDYPWALLRALLIIPRVLRDAMYDLVARNRYAWFGRRDSCRLPTPEERELFLTD